MCIVFSGIGCLKDSLRDRMRGARERCVGTRGTREERAVHDGTEDRR
jgi:hypothetical protein